MEHEDLLRLFVGKNYEYYAAKWKLVEQRSERAEKWFGKDSWNWAAFFIGFNWTAYRGMYDYSSILIFFLVIHLVLALWTRGSDEFNVVHVILAFIYGVRGNSRYKLHVEKKVKEITSSGASAEAIRMRIAQEGGTNLGAAAGFTAVMIILMMLIGAFGK